MSEMRTLRLRSKLKEIQDYMQSISIQLDICDNHRMAIHDYITDGDSEKLINRLKELKNELMNGRDYLDEDDFLSIGVELDQSIKQAQSEGIYEN
jgi:hypothetical protein